VGSFFVSRIDTAVDTRLDALESPRAAELRGQAAIAQAQLTHALHDAMLGEAEWSALTRRSAYAQRLLWASTGTKDPRYSAVKYVDALIAPDTITTVPPETLTAYRAQGRPEVRLTGGTDAASRIIAELDDCGIDLKAVSRELEEEGIRKFVQPYQASLSMIEQCIRRP
jgi:transaldolase